MAQPVVQLSVNLSVAHLTHEVLGLLPALLPTDDRIKRSRHEQDGQVRLGEEPILFGIGFLQQREEVQIAVDSKVEAAELVCVVLLHHLPVAADPAVGNLLVRRLVVGPQNEASQQLAAVAASLLPFQLAGEPQGHWHQGIFGGRAAENQLIQMGVVFLCVAASHQGTHAVAEEDVGLLGKQLLHRHGHLMKILHHSHTSIVIEEAQVIGRTKTLAMATMIVDDGHKTCRRQILHEVEVPLLVLRHSVGKLHHPPNLGVRHHHHHRYFKPVSIGFYRKVLSFHKRDTLCFVC